MKPMKNTLKDYNKLHEISRYIRTLHGVESVLAWDQETYMPSGGAKNRAEQLKILAGIVHKEMTGKKFVGALGKLIDIKTGKILQKGLTPPQEAAVKLWRRDYLKEAALPAKFVEDFAKLTSEAKHVWIDAKKNKSFKEFKPYLEKIVAMTRKKADYLGFHDHPYDALLDRFEPGMTASDVSKLFNPLKASTKALLKKIQSAKQIKDDVLHIPLDLSDQMSFSQKLLKLIDYPLEHGRLDISAHPFSSSSHPTDSRITTRMHPELFIGNIRTILHECGHAFYEMGLPVENFGSPLGEAISLGMHESQSRWWETRIGMSKPFWQFCLPHVKKHFDGKLNSLTPEQCWKAVNKVEPSFIRVEADEVTYGLHVILRFELEIEMIEGRLAIKDLPEAWNAKMKELLGITPKNDSEGCLQDVHWAFGAFGYFPTYSLGNMYAAHLFGTFEKQFPKWPEKIAKGEFTFMKDWLKKKIHQYGRTYGSQELLKQITGKPFTANAFTDYLNTKYKEVYNF